MCKKLYNTYLAWIAKQQNNCLQTKSQVRKIFERAKIKDKFLPITMPTGYGYVASGNVSVFDNFPSLLEDFVKIIMYDFEEALGYYKNSAIETINPLFWIDLFVFLPNKIITYIGADMEKISAKVLNVIFTIFWWAIVTACMIFKEEVITFVKELINKL